MTVLRDARLGVRLLWRQPGFTAVALLTLAIVMVWSRVQNKGYDKKLPTPLSR